MRIPQKTKKNYLLLLALALSFALLLTLYLVFLLPAEQAPPDDDDTTVETILMFPHVSRAEMTSIEVFNSYDSKTGKYQSYKFIRDIEDEDGDGDTNDFIIDGYPANSYDEEKFALLVVDTGHVSCLGMLEELDFSGLDEAGKQAIYRNYGLASDQNPTYFRLTQTDGTVRTVYIGARSLDGNYYARLDGQDGVYVMYSLMEESVLAPLSYFVEPVLTFEADNQYAYSYIRNFTVFRDRSLVDLVFGRGEEAPDIESGELSPFVMFTYLPESERDLFKANSAYAMLVPSGHYTPNDARLDAALQLLPGLTGIETLKLGVSDEDFKPGGLLADVAYTFYYEMPYNITYNEKGEPEAGYWMKNILFATPLAADGTYTVGSIIYTDEKIENEDGEEIDAPPLLNMIAKVAYEDLSFAEYTLFDWIQSEVLAISIDNLATLAFSSSRGEFIYDIHGDGNPGQTVTERYSGFTWYNKGRNRPFELNEQGYCDDIAQFRLLYMLLLSLDYEGAIEDDTDMTQAEIDAIMADDSNCILTFTVTMEDGREIDYRFFPYSERHCMVSVSGTDIDSVSTFYTSSTAVRHIADASANLVNGVEIHTDNRYA